MESTLQKPASVTASTPRKAKAILYWSVTALFCLQMCFTAYAQLSLPQVAEAFTHLGFPDYFRVELSWAKLLGVLVLLAPVPPRLKEWAYAGFAIDITSAVIAHLAVGQLHRHVVERRIVEGSVVAEHAHASAPRDVREVAERRRRSTAEPRLTRYRRTRWSDRSTFVL